LRCVPCVPADARYAPADLAIARIGDLLNYDFPALFGPARAVPLEDAHILWQR